VEVRRLFKKVHVFRVKPGRELLAEMAGFCREHGITSGVVLGIIGSLRSARLNFLKELPGRYESVDYTGPLEIVAAQGTVALEGDNLIIYVHIQLSRPDLCCGGHLAEAVVFSTAEVVIGELEQQLRRYPDSYTGLKELAD
jgi:predicted DNA-binding protein with PD1-like motif